MRRLLLLLALCVLWPSGAEASCSGSGLTWTCTAGSTVSQINSAISSSSNGATITLADGTYTGSGIDLSAGGAQNGVTVICESEGGCTFSSSGDTFIINACGADITNLVRVSGFVFSGAPSTGKTWVYCSDGFTIHRVRIDHNSFTNFAGSQAVFFGESSSEGEVYGVVDHNTFTGATNGMAMKNISGGTDWEIGLQGSANNIFFEDNTVTFTDNTDLGLGASDSWKAGGTVLRFNAVTGSRVLTHSLCHDGPVNFEVYFNTINNPTGEPDDYRNIHSQGSGEIIIFENTVENANGNAIAIQHYRSDASQMPQGDCTAAEICDGDWTAVSGVPLGDENRSGEDGYPCWHQPGRDDDFTLKPVYAWRNRTAAGTRVDISIESGGLIDSHFVENRDYYEAGSMTAQTSPTSPFNGTAGVGFGTLANRPTTCTAEADAEDAGEGGVAYWATDDGEWNSTNGATPDGQLYRCSSTNTWTVAYTPYCYPHPLQSGETECPEGGAGDPEPPTGPHRLRFRIAGVEAAPMVLGLIGLTRRARRRVA